MTPNIADLERIISSLKYDGIDTDSLTVGELRRALPAAATPSPSSAATEHEEHLARAIRKARDFDPDTLYQHLGDDYPTDSTDSEGRTFYKSWRKELPSVRAVLAALTGAPAQPSAMADDLDRLAFRLRQSADHDGPQELKMVMRRVATALDRTSQPSPAAPVDTTQQQRTAMMHARSSAGSASEPRFFIDHGMIHDRLTGKHVTTEPDSAFCDGIVKCCELLNSLVERRQPRVFPLLFDSNWLENKIKSDPDVECEAGPDLTRNEPQQPNMREALEDIWALTASFSQYTLEHFARKVRSKVDAALIGSELAPGCCSATSPCSHQKADPASICETCACREARQCLHIIPECVCDGDPTLIDNPAFQRNEPQQSTEVSATLRGAAQALVHEIQESGTHTRWKRLANAIATEDERTQPQRDTTKWPDTLGFDDRDKYIDELEAQIERLRAVPQAAREPDRDAVAAIVLKAMQAKVDPDTYGASYAIKINADRATIAADAILSLRRPEHNATNIT